jgi:hypothetical protein
MRRPPSLALPSVAALGLFMLLVAGCGQDVTGAPGGSDAATNAATQADAAAGDSDSVQTDTGPVDAGTFNNACATDSDCAAQFPELGDCQVAKCDEATGVCSAENKPDGTEISPAKCVDDGKGPVFHIALQCASGGVPFGNTQKKCDDAAACAEPTCDAAKGCGSKPKAGTCDDGDACTLKDTCDNGACKGTAEQVCDGTTCMAAKCDSATGKCVQTPTGDKIPCDDGDKCTEKDACISGKCEGAQTNCDDNKPCTTDTCDAAAGCKYTHNTFACDDGDKCTEKDACKAGKCQPGKAICQCKVDKDCDQSGGDKCKATHFCDTAAVPFTCKEKTAAKLCPTSNKPCMVSFCDSKSGACVVGPGNDAKACDDGDKCNGADQCGSGKCNGGPPVKCPAGGVCTVGTCAAKVGCTVKPKAGACDDGDKCTTGDACKDGKCAATGKLTCDDKIACTSDSCDAAKGCVFDAGAMNSKGCDDGSICNVGETCTGGKCGGGAAKTCDDGKKCTSDKCDGKAGCAFTPIAGCNNCGADPQCIGAALPSWKLLDKNPTSTWKNQTYGPAKFKGTPVVLFLLYGY